MTIEKRQPARFINIRRRFQALTSQERVLATKLQKLILVTIFRARTVESDEEREKSSALAHLALRKYCTILYFEDDGIPRPIRLDSDRFFLGEPVLEFFRDSSRSNSSFVSAEVAGNLQTTEWTHNGWRRSYVERTL